MGEKITPPPPESIPNPPESIPNPQKRFPESILGGWESILGGGGIDSGVGVCGPPISYPLPASPELSAQLLQGPVMELWIFRPLDSWPSYLECGTPAPAEAPHLAMELGAGSCENLETDLNLETAI